MCPIGRTPRQQNNQGQDNRGTQKQHQQHAQSSLQAAAPAVTISTGQRYTSKCPYAAFPHRHASRAWAHTRSCAAVAPHIHKRRNFLSSTNPLSSRFWSNRLPRHTPRMSQDTHRQCHALSQVMSCHVTHHSHPLPHSHRSFQGASTPKPSTYSHDSAVVRARHKTSTGLHYGLTKTYTRIKTTTSHKLQPSSLTLLTTSYERGHRLQTDKQLGCSGLWQPQL